MEKLVNIKLHNVLGDEIGHEWNLNIKSCGEAIRAINILTKRKLYRVLYQNDKKNIYYQILINKRPFISEKELEINDLEGIRNSELVCNIGDLETIDVIPILNFSGGGGNGGKGILGIILGVILIVVGAFTTQFGIGVPLIVAGVGLVAAGVVTLLTSPPKFADFREIDGQTGRTSYLFNGPQNTTREGGPVPVGYGRLVVGSQVISAAYNIRYIDADAQPLIIDVDGTLSQSYWTHFTNTDGLTEYIDPIGRGNFVDRGTLGYNFLGVVVQKLFQEKLEDGSYGSYFLMSIPYADRTYRNSLTHPLTDVVSVATLLDINTGPSYFAKPPNLYWVGPNGLVPNVNNNNQNFAFYLKDGQTIWTYNLFPGDARPSRVLFVAGRGAFRPLPGDILPKLRL